MHAAVSTFVGRDEEGARLADWIERHRMVTVVGPGGIGKTRLASELAPRVADALPGGLLRCELAQVTARDEIGIEAAGLLGFPSLESLVVSLGEAPSLLVLDNCEHVVGAVARLCERLLAAAPALHLLATSREPLGIDGERVLVLGPLANASATRLFEDRARGAGARLDASADELAARAELCRRLDGVPLAIELAAARARSLTAVEILALLGRRFDLLQRSTPVGRARHRSLRAAIDASYELLDAEEQGFFRALGVFAGPFAAPLAHAVAAPPGFDALDTVDALARLVDRSLVIAEPARGVTRYRLLDSLRDYAAEQARAAGEDDAVTGRFLDAMVAEADRIVASAQTRWSAELLADVLVHFETLIFAIERALEVDRDAGRAFRLLLPLWGATHQGRAAEAAAIGERVLARWPDGDEPLRREAVSVVAGALLAAGAIERASELARGPAAAADAPLARVLALRTLGAAARQRGDDAAAVAHYERAAALAAKAGLASFERELVVLAASTPRAGAALEEALATLEAVCGRAMHDCDPIGVVWARIVATHHLVRAGRLPEARAMLASARAAQEGFEYPYGAKVTRRLHATLVTLERGWAASRADWIAAIDRCAGSGDLAELALALRGAAALAGRAGDHAARAAMLAAVPAGVHLSVLGALFEEEGAAAAIGERDHPPRAVASAALRRVREALAADATPVAAPPQPPERTGALLRAGDGWTVRFADRTLQVRHLKGLDDLVVLLARADAEVHCLELMGGADVGGDAGPVLDADARRAYQARIRDLQTEIDDARDANDGGRAERAEVELDALVQQLAEAFGLGGRARATGSPVERARSAVTWRVRAAIKRLAELHPELGRHLANAVRTGTWCSYRPEAPIAWELRDQGRSS